MLLGIGQYLWRLVPGNPILRRVVESGGKRKRDLGIRCAYLGLLVVVVLGMLLASAGSLGGADLAALTKRSGEIFQSMSYVQLVLVALLAPIFTAGAITQEKDSQTYDILLSTPLTNGQIVLGSLLSRLFFIVALLVSGIPIFSITQIFGGVAIQSIVHSFAIAAATAFITGSLAMAMAAFKVGTRRTIFSFYLFTVLFMAIPVAIEQMGYLQFPGAKKGTHVSWLAGINPFLALRVIFNDGKYMPPVAGSQDLAGYSWWTSWYLSSPHTFYVSFMFTLSFVLVMPSIVMLRRLAQSTTSLRVFILQKLHIVSGDKRRKVRRVWSNPIAWREAKTKASAARAVVLRYLFTGAGIIGAFVLMVMYATHEHAPVVIGSEGYDGANQQLAIIDNGRYHAMGVPQEQASKIQVTINGKRGQIEDIRGLMKVISYDPPNGNLKSISVADPESRLDPGTVRKFLLGAVLVELAVILLIVTQSAASTVTREKEDGTLDLLLSTPITSRYYIWGKLRGLVSFAIPLLAVPIVSLLIFIIHDLWLTATATPGSFAWIVFPESLVVLPPALIIVCAFASILGMQMSLRCKTTVMAVMSSVGIVGALCLGLGACGLSALSKTEFGQGGLIVGAFSPFTLAAILIDPQEVAKSVFGPAASADTGGARVLLTMSGWIVTGVYAAIVWAMYKGMVKNFDMTIRKQAY